LHIETRFSRREVQRTSRIESTKRDKSKIDLADVDSGAKILVWTVEEGSAAAAVAIQQNKNATECKAVLTIVFFIRCIPAYRVGTKFAGGKFVSRLLFRPRINSAANSATRLPWKRADASAVSSGLSAPLLLVNDAP
jgi:hypothetical protein